MILLNPLKEPKECLHVMSWVEFKAFNQIRTVLVSFEGFGIYLDYGIRGNGIRINIIKAKSMAEIHR